jgi:Na+-transporting NADH:ubiquinone oxidoreductase subunit C
MQSNIKIYLYVLVLTGVTAALLSFLYNALDPIQTKNKEDAKKRSILSSIPDLKGDVDFDKKVMIALLDSKGKTVFEQSADSKKEDIDKILSGLNKRGEGVKYTKLIDVDLSLEEKFSQDKRVYPVYSYTNDNGNAVRVVSVRGNGLWDKIWGYVALGFVENKWTVLGVNFDHKAETPGLGAEIKDSKDFKDQFKGKSIFDETGNYVSVSVVKAPKDKSHEVKSISGATVTSVGVSEMMIKGISNYLPYLESKSVKK